MKREQLLALALGIVAASLLALLFILAVLPEDTKPNSPQEAAGIQAGLDDDESRLESLSSTPLLIALAGLGFASAAGFAGLAFGARQRMNLERGE